MAVSQTHDVIVLGGGAAGVVAAKGPANPFWQRHVAVDRFLPPLLLDEMAGRRGWKSRRAVPAKQNIEKVQGT